MALKFIEQHAIYNRSSDRLRFFANDRGLSLTFALSRKVLDHLEGSQRVPEAKLLAAFERHKDEIRVAAARAYLATGATREAIAVNPEHVRGSGGTGLERFPRSVPALAQAGDGRARF